MTDVIETRPDHNRDAEAPGLTNPLAVGLSIVAVIAAIILAVRSVLGGDHRAHVWNVRLLGVVIVAVAALAVLRLGAQLARRPRSTRQVDLAPVSLEAEAWSRARPGGGVRRHRRVVPAVTTTSLATLDGRRIQARIINVSMGGVAVEATLTDLDIAAIVEVGTRSAAPVRRTQTGAVFRFDRLLDPLEFDQGLVL